MIAKLIAWFLRGHAKAIEDAFNQEREGLHQSAAIAIKCERDRAVAAETHLKVMVKALEGKVPPEYLNAYAEAKKFLG